MKDNTIHPTHTTRSNTLDALDCISRQLVIDLVHLTILEFIDYCADSEEVPVTEKDKLLLEINKKIGTRIKELPSAQPELAQHLPNTCTDAISRQAAIDALWHSIEEDNSGELQSFAEVVIGDAVYEVKALPSVQPDVPDTNVGDMISRQAAIDAFYKYPNVYWTTLDILTELQAFPSAQPEVAKDTNVPSNDCISRQAAIDEINKYILSFDAIDANFLDGLKTAIKIIKENFPSAQPERIRCKDCLMHGVCRFEQGLGLDGYCSKAERREDG